METNVIYGWISVRLDSEPAELFSAGLVGARSRLFPVGVHDFGCPRRPGYDCGIGRKACDLALFGRPRSALKNFASCGLTPLPRSGRDATISAIQMMGGSREVEILVGWSGLGEARLGKSERGDEPAGRCPPLIRFRSAAH